MASYSCINGTVHYDDAVDENIEADLCTSPYSELYFHDNKKGEQYFSFGIKECDLDIFFNLLKKWKNYFSIEFDGKNPIEIYMTLSYETDYDRIDVIIIRDGKISHRHTST